MPLSLTQDEQTTLNWAAEEYSRWFDQRLWLPLSHSLSSLLPQEIRSHKKAIDTLRGATSGWSPSQPPLDDALLPIAKRALVHYRRTVAEQQSALRSRTVHRETHDSIDALIAPIEHLMHRDWFKAVSIALVPKPTDFLTLAEVYASLPRETAPPKPLYDEKFGLLQSPNAFPASLRWHRQEAWLRGVPICVAFIDLDRFKSYNSALTESVVDRDLLPQVMRTIEASLFAHGEAFRLGGDEYLAVFPNSDLAAAARLLDGMRRRLQAISVPHPPGPVTCSIGVVEILPDCHFGDYEIQAAANRAKDFAKASGKDVMASFRGLDWTQDELGVYPSPYPA